MLHDWTELLGFIGSVFGIFGGIAWLWKIWEDSKDDPEKRQAQGTVIGAAAAGKPNVLRSPPELTFYIVAVWSFGAAALGGFFWNVLNRVNSQYHLFGPSSYVGGTASEPHGLGAVVWPLATNVPMVVALVLLDRRYDFTRARSQLLLYGSAFLMGSIIASVTFYDLPIFGKNGVRAYLESSNASFVSREIWLAFIWALLISGLGFFAISLVQNMVSKVKTNAVKTGALRVFLVQVGPCVALTVLAVVAVLLAFPDERRFDTARGVVAGTALRMTLFFGLLSTWRSSSRKPRSNDRVT